MRLSAIIIALAARVACADFFRNDFLPVGHVRTDAIINQDCLSDHVHTFYGPPLLYPKVTFEDLRISDPNLSSGNIMENNSLYWHPAAYHVASNGMKTLQEPEMVTVYYNWVPGKTTAFPPGFRMITPGEDVFDEGIMSGESEMELSISFQSCWDGTNLDSPDHMSHVAFPEGENENSPCPSSHPVRLPRLDFFIRWFNTKATKWEFSDGSKRFHADYISGWDESFLQSLLNGGDGDFDSKVTFRAGIRHQGHDSNLIKQLNDNAVPKVDTSCITTETIDKVKNLPRGTCTGTLVSSYGVCGHVDVPSVSPTESYSPTVSPTNSPTMSPTVSPTAPPTHSPSRNPTRTPTKSPPVSPTRSPGSPPVMAPTKYPTASPTLSPTRSATKSPTRSPIKPPTKSPTLSPHVPPPTNLIPTSSPTISPNKDSNDVEESEDEESEDEESEDEESEDEESEDEESEDEESEDEESEDEESEDEESEDEESEDEESEDEESEDEESEDEESEDEESEDEESEDEESVDEESVDEESVDEESEDEESESEDEEECLKDPNKNAIFFTGEIKMKKGQEVPLKKKCKWLADQSHREISDMCDMTDGWDELPPAREVCTGTCNSCSE